MYRTMLVAAAAALLGSTALSAADVRGRGDSTKDLDAPRVAHVQNWSGLYGGIGCGVSSTTVGTEDSKGGISANGQTCDARLGLDVQRGMIVFGGFANYAFTNEALELGSMTLVEKDDQWDINARLGFASGNGLFYVHGGYGQATYSSPLGGGDLDVDLWQAGVGLEYAVATNWTIGLEYTHAWLDLDSIGAGPIDDFLDAETDKVMLRTNYKFNSDTFRW